MSYAIIGFGRIGHALAKAFARKGIEVSVATTRDPQSFASAAAAIGPTIIPKKLAEAVKADIVFLAVRFESHPDVAKALPNWKGKTIIDVTNAYGVPPEKLAGQPSSKVVAQAFAGARLVKGFVATGKIKATNRAFKDDWVFDITVRHGKLTKIREYIDTQALARASQRDASGLA